MAVPREDQAFVVEQTTVATPMTLGLADCLALILGLILMLIAAAFPDAERDR